MLVLLVVSLFAVVFYVMLRRAFIARAMVDYLRDKACHPVDPKLLVEIREDAVTYGLEEEFERYLVAITKFVGEGNVKNGHVLWVLDQLDKDIMFNDAVNLPRFD